MRSRSFISSFKGRDPLLAVGLFAALVLVLECIFALLPPNGLVKALQADRLPPGAPDWQIMGDSVAQGGILVDEVQKFLPGQTVYNAAMAATGPEFSYFVLQRELAAGRAPKAILCAPSPHTFASDRTALLIGGYCHWGELPVIAATGRELCEQIYGVLCKLSYTLRYREELGGILRGRGDEEESATAGTGAAKGERIVKHCTAATIHPMYKKAFTVNALNEALFDKFLRLAREHGIPVYWVTMPVLPAVQAGRQPFKFDEAYAGFLAGLHERYGVHVLLGGFSIWDETRFGDMTHLNHTGAIEFSRQLGQRLADLQASDLRRGPASHPRGRP